jgi:hypothetical protein
MRDHPIFSVILGLVPRTHGAPVRASWFSHARATDKWVLGASPRMTGLGVAAVLSLAACNAEPEKAPPKPVEKVSAVAPAAAAAPATPVALSDADLRRVCRAGLAAIHGQDENSITIDALNGPIVNVSWRAPVDGGRRRAQCRVDGDLVVWKPADRTSPIDDRWMNQAGDPVTRFVLDGETVTISQTLPDGGVASNDRGQG